MLKVFDVWRSFGAVNVLAGASFELKPSSIAGLIGPSGGGKSTLLKILGGVGKRDYGEAVFSQPHNGASSVPANHTERAGNDDKLINLGCSTSLMFQEGALFDSMTVLDNVAFPLTHGSAPLAGLPKQEREAVLVQAADILARVGLTKSAYKYPAQLSGGMRRRVSLARALISRPELVLLDDPTSGLDPVASSIIMDLISELHREYLPTTIMVSHDLRRLLPVIDTLVALFHGRVVFCGPVKDLLNSKNAELLHFIECRFNLDSLGGKYQESAAQRSPSL